MNKLEKRMWRKVERYLPFLSAVPFLRMVAVCNNLAFGEVDEKSDIDLFIVARRRRLFIARTFVTMILQVLGVRRHGNKVAGRFCLSFFVDDSALDLEKIAIKDDHYLKYWVKSLRPVLDDGVRRDFAQENEWVGKFELDDDHLIKKSSFLKRILEFAFGGLPGDFVERMLKNWQLKRARKKLEALPAGHGVIVSENLLKFHNVDRREEFRTKFGKLL